MKKQMKTPLYVELPDDLYRRLKDIAYESRASMTTITRAALEAYLTTPVASTHAVKIDQTPKFTRFLAAWTGKSFSYALSQLGITNPDLQAFHATAAGVPLSEKANQRDAYVYLLARAAERGL